MAPLYIVGTASGRIFNDSNRELKDAFQNNNPNLKYTLSNQQPTNPALI
jgi:hypothetical protein